MSISSKSIVARVVISREIRKKAGEIAQKEGRSFSNWAANLIRKEVAKKQGP